METVIPVVISEKLQSQILILCAKIPRHEWSGTLFYEVTGEFGEPEFSITAKELYLQDIGSAAYTEYDTGDPEFIQFLMRRADLREIRQGHIHSHNTMGVFFSGTDDDELKENSEFHNYYFSLIVNNNNDMKAKVAFRADVDSETTSQMKYRDTNGTVKFKTVKNTTTTTYVYTYDCDITLPSIITDIYADMKKVEPKGRPSGSYYSSYSPGKSYNNGNLFSETEEERVIVPKVEENDEVSPAMKWAEEQRRDKKKVNEKEEKKESVLRSSVDFLVKLVTMDPERKGTLDEAIRDAVNATYQRENRDSYMQQMDEKVPVIYKEFYPPNKLNPSDISRALRDSIDLVELFEESYPVFCRNVTELLNGHLKSVNNGQ